MQSVLFLTMGAFSFGVTSCGGDKDKKPSGKGDDQTSMIPDAKDVESAVNDIFEGAKPLVDSVAKGLGGAISDEDYEKAKETAKETAGKISKEAIDSAAGQINIIKEEAAKKLDEAKEQLGMSSDEDKGASLGDKAETQAEHKPAEPKEEKEEKAQPELRTQEAEKPGTERTTVAKVPPAPKSEPRTEIETRPAPAPMQRPARRTLPERDREDVAQDEKIEGDVVLQNPEEGPAASRCRCPRKNGAGENACNCSEQQNGCTCGTGYCNGCDCTGAMAAKDNVAESEGPSALAVIGIILLALLLIAVIALIVVLTKKNKTDTPNMPPYGSNGYRQYGNGYNQPNSYGNPANGYQQPSNGYQQPTNGYEQPLNGYQQPTNGYEQPENVDGQTPHRIEYPEDTLDNQ